MTDAGLDHAAHVVANSLLSLAHAIRDASQTGNNSAILKGLAEIKENIMAVIATQAEVTEQLKASKAVLDEISAETDTSLQLIKDLQAAVANQTNATPELVAASQALADQLQVVADKIPNTTPAA